jgi:hypothetical protein
MPNIRLGEEWHSLPLKPVQITAELRSELVRQDKFQSATDFPTVIGPDPDAPVTEIAGLRAKQVKERIAIALFICRNSWFQYLFMKM